MKKTITQRRKAKKSPSRRLEAKAPVLPEGISQSMAKVLRPQAAYRWLLPQLAAITPQYIEMTLRGALAGNHVQAWELFDLMEDTWPRLSKNANQLKMEVQQEMLGWRARPFQEEDEPATESAKQRARLVNAALRFMRPKAAADENAFPGTVYDIMDGWLKGQVVLETDWEVREAGKLGMIVAPRATFWAHPTCVAWSMEGELGLRLELAQGSATLTPGVWTTTTSQPMPSRVAPFPEHKFLVGIAKAKSGTALGAARLRALCWWWCAANFSADWLLNLAQLWQLPFRWANYDPNAPQATIDSICSMLENMGSNAWAAFPAGTQLELKESKQVGGNGPADNMLDRADKNCDLLVLGQTLTSDVSQDAGSRSQGEVHERVEAKICRAACGYVADVLNNQLIPSLLVLNYGDENERPLLCADAEEVGTLEFKRSILQNWSQHATLSAVLANLSDLKQMVRDSGLPVNEEYEDPYVPVMAPSGQLVGGELIRDSEQDVIGANIEHPTSNVEQGQPGTPGTGKDTNSQTPGKTESEIPDLKPEKPEAGAEARESEIGNLKSERPSPELEESGMDHFAAAIAYDLQVVREELEALLRIEDDRVLIQREAAFRARLDQLKQDILALPKSAQALGETMIAALFTGLTEKTTTKRAKTT